MDTNNRSEIARKEIELRQSLILSSVPMAVYATRAYGDMGAVYLSENIEKITGFKAAHFLEDTRFWHSRVHPEDLERISDDVEEVVSNGSFEIEYRWRCSDGTYHWFLDRSVLIEDENGSPHEVVGTWLDITERKGAEQSLKETNEKLIKKNRFEEIVTSVLKSVHGSLKLQNVLESAADAIHKNLDNVSAIEIYTVENSRAVLKAHHGVPDNYVRQVRVLEGPDCHTWTVLNFGETLYIKDSDIDTRMSPVTKRLGIMSSLSMAVRFNEKTIGCINLYSLHKDAFGQDEIELLEIITRQIEVATKHAKQAEELSSALQEVNKLKKRFESESVYLEEEIKTEHNFEEIVGESPVLAGVLDKVQKVAGTDATVLIRGETGTGKELIARSIHSLSKRSGRPLVKVNCPAIPSGLIESELFGHEKGAFTGALSKKIGKFELSDGGTIMLDELGDLPLDSQAKLLRVLQEKEFERVGGTKTIRVDVRVIAATNRDLEKAVEEGKFRADLYYRLNVFPIQVPALRERTEDIGPLSEHFMKKYSGQIGKDFIRIGKDTMRKLQGYSWPGNIRELENIIERAAILSLGDTIEVSESLISPKSNKPGPRSSSSRLEDIERDHIIGILESTGWQVHGDKGAAKVLGINPNTLRTRMAKLGIKKKTITVI